jgi:hypothetical protein
MLAEVGDFLAVDEGIGIGLGRGIGFAMLRPPPLMARNNRRRLLPVLRRSSRWLEGEGLHEKQSGVRRVFVDFVHRIGAYLHHNAPLLKVLGIIVTGPDLRELSWTPASLSIASTIGSGRAISKPEE